MKIAKVSTKGQVVIPIEMRKKFRITKVVAFIEQKGRIYIEPVMTFEEAFGTGGKEMYEVAREISKNRSKEIELEG